MLRRGAVAAGVLALLALGGWLYARHWRPSANDFPLQGIETSADDGAIDWALLRAAGADFVYLDATTGTARDRAFARSWSESAGAGMRRGAVHRWSFCADAEAQATAMLSTVPRAADALPAALAIDFAAECTRRPERAALLAQLRAFIAASESHAGKPMLVQASPAVERAYALTGDLGRPVWVVGNFRTPGYAAKPWAMWRASDMLRVAGVEGPVRWNVVRP